MTTTTDLLKNVPIFKDLDSDELARVAEICREEQYASGAYVFHEGEPGSRLYIIVSGEVRISRNVPGTGEEALAILKPGGVFGEMAVLDRTERSTDAIANGGCTLLSIARPDFEMLLDFDHELAHKVLWALVRLLSMRLRQANDSLKSFIAMSIF